MTPRKPITVEFTDAEIAALEGLAKKKDMSTSAVLRQALRLYQSVEIRLERGELVFVETPKILWDDPDPQ